MQIENLKKIAKITIIKFSKIILMEKVSALYSIYKEQTRGKSLGLFTSYSNTKAIVS